MYDLLNRRTQTTDAGGGVTVFRHGRLYTDSIRDAVGQVYRYGYNALGWLETRTDPLNQVERYTYDRNGNPTAWTNRRGQNVAFSYDALDQLTSRTAPGITATFSTDARMRFATAANAESTDTLHLDVAGRPTREVAVRGAARYNLEADYNVRDLRTALRLTSPWTRSIGYRYNAEMQLDSLIDLAGGRTGLTYNDDRQLSLITLPTGVGIGRDYPSTHTAATISYSTYNLNHRIGAAYSYGERGLVEAKRNLAADTMTTYSYDAMDRLRAYVTESVSNPSGPLLYRHATGRSRRRRVYAPRRDHAGGGAGQLHLRCSRQPHRQCRGAVGQPSHPV